MDSIVRGLTGKPKRQKPAKTFVPLKQRNEIAKKDFGLRMVAARELNGFTQTEASDRLGAGNSTQLCLWERGKRMPPDHMLKTIATVYGVSLDYLFGLSDEPERDPKFAHQQALIRSMEDVLRKNAEAVSQALTVYTLNGGMNMLAWKDLHTKASDLLLASKRFSEMNGGRFENMKGSATVMHACKALDASVRDAGHMIRRHDGIKEDAIRCAEKASGRNTLPLFDTPEYRRGEMAATGVRL